MRVILVSTPNKSSSEAELANRLFAAGLDLLHVRKPKFSRRRLRSYLEKIEPQYRDRLVIYQHFGLARSLRLGGVHLLREERQRRWRWRFRRLWFRLSHPKLRYSTSFHSALSVQVEKGRYDYVLLSSVYRSVDSPVFNASFDPRMLASMLEQTPLHVVAMGGIQASKMAQIQGLGFWGAAISGAIWDEPKERREAVLREILAAARKEPSNQEHADHASRP